MSSRLTGYACLLLAVGALVLASSGVFGSHTNQRWYTKGYPNALQAGLRGSIQTYANTPVGAGHFTAIYIVVIFQNLDWLAVGYYQGVAACGTQAYPTWYWDEMVGGMYHCGFIDNRFPTTGTYYDYRVYNVPGTYSWNGAIDSGLVRTQTFLYNNGNIYGYGEANNDGNQMNSHFKYMKYGRVQGGCCIFWYDWPVIYTYQNYPYYVTVISNTEFTTSSQVYP